MDDQLYHDFLDIIHGARNGLIYGAKFRFSHALAMAIFFGRSRWKTHWKAIFSATKRQALTLAKFVAIYKFCMIVARRANGGVERDLDSFFAGSVAGYFVFRDRSAITEQMTLYALSRALGACIPRASGPSVDVDSTLIIPLANPRAHFWRPADPTWFAALAAGAGAMAMYIFRYRGETLHPVTFASMLYLYRDSEHWKDLRTLLWHNY